MRSRAHFTGTIGVRHALMFVRIGSSTICAVALSAAIACSERPSAEAAPAESFSILAPRSRLASFDTIRLSGAVGTNMGAPLPSRKLSWTSSDSTIVALAPDGLLTARSPGTAIIEATYDGSTSYVAITVIEHSDTVTLSAGEDIAARVAAAPSATTFRLKAGKYLRQRIVPKDGMSFIGDSGAVLDGENRTDFAFVSDSVEFAHNVVIRGLVIERYDPPLQSGAIRADVPLGGWTIADCELRYNAAGAIRLGDRARILRNRIHHNAQIGILGRGDGILVEGNEISYNNPDAKYDMYWEAGGTKFARTRDLVVRDNFVHHNHGPGLWTDIDNIRTLYEKNRVEDNAESGIFHEISFSAVIRNNIVRRNGVLANPPGWVSGAGILVNSSSDVEISGNTVEDNHNGITAIEAHRGVGAFGPYALRNLIVHDNSVRMGAGVTGMATSGWRRFVDRATYAAMGNRFEANKYVLSGTAGFRLGRSFLTPDEWRSRGYDQAGSFGEKR